MNVQPNAEAIEAGAQALRDAAHHDTCDKTCVHPIYASAMTGDLVTEVCAEPAEAARTVLAAVVPDLRAQWAKEAAYDIRAELVCCDIYAEYQAASPEDQDDRRGFVGGHEICYWGEASALIVECHGKPTTGEPT